MVRQSHRSSAISADDEILSYYLGHLPRPSLFHLPPHLPAHLSNDAVERLASEAAHVPVEEQLDDLLYVCRPNDHAKRLEECSEIHTRCATLLGLYHSLDPRDTTEKHTLEIRNAVASLAFSHSFTALAPSLMSREMIPALRSLCHLRVVCRTGSRVPVAGEHEWESLSAVPPIDLDGTVAWEEIEQVQGLLCGLGGTVLTQTRWLRRTVPVSGLSLVPRCMKSPARGRPSRVCLGTGHRSAGSGSWSSQVLEMSAYSAVCRSARSNAFQTTD